MAVAALAVTHAPNQHDDSLPKAKPNVLLEHAAAGTAAGLPLNEVFRALAEDLDDGRLSRTSQRLADELDRGADLATAMRSVQGDELPPHLHGALLASADTGQTAAMLQGLAHHETTRKRMRRQMRSALLYPAIVLTLLASVVYGLLAFVVPHFQDVYEDFDLTLPAATLVVLEASKTAPQVILGVLLAPVLYLLVSLSPDGRRLMHWLRTGVPLVGRIWVWNGHHEFSSVLGSLVSQQVSLDDALRCTVASLRDRNLARATRIAAIKCENGVCLSQALAESIHFDRVLTSLVAWGEANSALPEALRQASARYEKEIDLQAILLRRIMPPLLFIAVAATMFTFVVALMVPLVDLIDNLS